ncbi:stage III sporulation AC/AD family protein [Faecalibacterium wellingii]|nr:stage III sporulation AC/AD family protein [Faecalibacterium sp. HTF-F]
MRGVWALSRRVDGTAFSCLLRCAGILLITDYARTLCEEAGADSLAWCTGLAGRLLVLAAAFPLLEEICQRIWGLAA